MFKTTERELLIKKYAKNEFEKEYILNLENEVFEQVEEVIESMEKWGDEVTFYDIMEQSMVTCIHKYDFKTQYIMEERFPNVEYIMLQYKASGSEWDIKMDDDGSVTVKLNMKPEQHMIMTLLGTLDKMTQYFYEQGVSHNCIIKNTIGVSE